MKGLKIEVRGTNRETLLPVLKNWNAAYSGSELRITAVYPAGQTKDIIELVPVYIGTMSVMRMEMFVSSLSEKGGQVRMLFGEINLPEAL